MLLNRNATAKELTVTIHSSDGESYPANALSLTRKEVRNLNIRTLLPHEANESLGGIELNYYGPPMTIAAYISIQGFHGFGNLEIPLLENQDFKSTTLSALWWEPIGARSYVVLGNSSTKTVHAGHAQQ